jgi:cytochrome c556
MIRTALVAACLGLGVTVVLAQPDPIAERRSTMKAVGGATRDGAAIAKGEVAFDAAKAQAIFKTYVDAAAKMPTLYPETSRTGGDTRASPRIWEDKAGFEAAFARFGEDARAGLAASDLAGFRSAFGAVTRNCGACHEAYRARR